MDEQLTIAKPDAKTARITQSFDLLKEKGREYIESLGSDFWTDYNVHDPGITFLDMLAYVLTDLDYRTSYHIRDILNLEEGTNYFHSARESLTVNPVTINDYRKLLVNIEGVRNAWLTEANEQEIRFYLDEIKAQLTYVAITDAPEIKLRGLYRVLLEFEDSEEFGDLNQQTLKRSVRLGGEDRELEFVFPRWTELALSDIAIVSRTWVQLGTTTALDFLPADVIFNADERGYDVTLKVTFTYLQPHPEGDPGFLCYKDDPEPVPPPPFDPIEIEESFDLPILVRYDGLKDELNTALETTIESLSPDGIIAFYKGMLAEIMDIVNRAQCSLMEHRNLCEDYFRIESLQTEEIGICMDVEVKPDANIEAIMAELYYRVSEFIAPTIRFYTLREMQEKGFKADQIFNGPPLDHGFILDEELDAAILRSELHASDIISIIMDIEGVIAVRGFSMVNYLEGIAQTEGEPWVLELTGDNLHAPRLSLDKSKISFYRDVLPDQPDMSEVMDLLEEMKAREVRGRLTEADLDIDIPVGEDLDIANYTSIQNGFPLTYGIGRDGIPGEPDALREAQAKQLKGFLLFFDQLLANYLCQLSHLRDLFSMEITADLKTYFVQAVTDIKGVDKIYAEYDTVTQFEPVEAALYAISEDSELREERRNMFLDHLLARFAENFSEYALIMYSLRKEKAAAELIEDKVLFLQDYPVISADRMKAFNYRPKLLEAPGVPGCTYCAPLRLWNTEENVSGYKKRVSRLMGFDSYERKNLTCHCFIIEKIDHHGVRDDVWVWKLLDPDTHDALNPMLTSIEYETEEAAKFAVTYAIVMVEEERLYMRPPAETDCSCCNRVLYDDLNLLPIDDGSPRVVLLNPCDSVLACGPVIMDEEELEAAYEKILTYVNDRCNVEGFHLIEHILLRPKTTDDRLLTLCLADDETPLKKIKTVTIKGAKVSTAAGKLFYEIYIDIAGEWRFRARDHTSRIILKSEGYASIAETQADIALCKAYTPDITRYKLETTVDGRYYFNLVMPEGEIVATSYFWNTKAEREAMINYLITIPVTSADDGGGVTADEEDEPWYCEDQLDPYSFRMSIVLPAWARRFRNIEFRKLVEKTLRMEAPAHVSLKICWIDRWQMEKYECAYLNWLLANGKCDPELSEITPALNNFIIELESLKNIYPVATLHNCDESPEDSQRVVLNNTSLGTL